MPLLQWGDWRPDTSDYEGASAFNIQNVIPRGDGYGPFPDFSVYSSALPAACRGAFYALKSDGSVITFAGTSTRLYRLNNTDYTWIDVSKGTAAYSGITGSAQWRFAQFNNFIIAVQANTVPQVYDLSSSSAFADLAGSPPQAAYIDIVGRFVVLSGLLSNPYRIQWSGLNATTTWTSGVNSSDYQDLPDGGIVRGVAGGDQSAIIFQDQAIRRMSYVPGSPIIFQIDRIAQGMGLYAPYSIIRSGETTFFYAGQGFFKIEPGRFPQQIGREKVDRTFANDLDKGNLQLFMGAADPRSSRIYWAYKSINGLTGSYDKILGYDKVLDRFFKVSMSGHYLMGISQTGLTLENLDSISTSIDAMTLTFDAYATAVQPEIGQFSSTDMLGFFRGANLEATLVSSEQGTDGQRIFVKGFRPVTDAPSVYGSISYRDATSAASTQTSEIAKNARTGRCDLRKSTRYARYINRIPAGTVWTFTAGIEPDVALEGTQ
jgi:hypothetical protein